jgi:pimeloyl-ACP methyl ester carboxylesterase
MSDDRIKNETINIAGLPVHLYSLVKTPASAKLTVLFFLHGRLGQYQDHIGHFYKILEHHDAHRHEQDSDLVIATFDQRNHGHRIVSKRANTTWQDKPSNSTHAQDMHAIQVGTARDVCLIMDYFGSYLAGNQIVRYLCAGVSLGGHATWLALSMDDRLQAGVPIIGCPDFMTLMEGRARNLQRDGKGELTRELFPDALRETVNRLDPKVKRLADKRFLVLCGARDKLVPFEAGRSFIEGLQKAQASAAGKTTVIIEENVGHRCSPAMIQHLCTFVADEMHLSPARL